MDKESNLEDFKAVLHECGHAENDFEINAIDLTQYTPNSSFVSEGKVTVKRKSTTKERTYRSGYNRHWVLDFEEELKKGIFD